MPQALRPRLLLVPRAPRRPRGGRPPLTEGGSLVRDILDRILVPRGWVPKRVGKGFPCPEDGLPEDAFVLVRRREDESFPSVYGRASYSWIGEDEFLLGSDSWASALAIASVSSPELEPFSKGYSSPQELRLALTAAGLL